MLEEGVHQVNSELECAVKKNKTLITLLIVGDHVIALLIVLVLKSLADVVHVLTIDIDLFKVLEILNLFLQYLQIMRLSVLPPFLQNSYHCFHMLVLVVHHFNFFHFLTIVVILSQELRHFLLKPHVIVRSGGSAELRRLSTTTLRLVRLIHIGVHKIHVVIVVLQKHPEYPLLQLLLECVNIDFFEKVLIELHLRIVGLPGLLLILL